MANERKAKGSQLSQTQKDKFNNRQKYRLKFCKKGPVRFIGHLDLQSLFAMAIKRANLPVAYSEGFNPHQLISFALPLSLGYYSNAEYVDITMAKALDTRELVEKLNENMPEGIKIFAAKMVGEDEKSSAASIAACDYKVTLPDDKPISYDIAVEFIKQKSIIVSKKTKSTVADTDIKPDIYSFMPVTEGSLLKELSMRISAGPKRSIRADLLMKALYSFADLPYPEFELKFCREEMHVESGKDSPLMAL